MTIENLDEFNAHYSSDAYITKTGRKVRKHRIIFPSQSDDVREVGKEREEKFEDELRRKRRLMPVFYRKTQREEDKVKAKETKEARRAKLRDIHRKRKELRLKMSRKTKVNEMLMSPEMLSKREEIIKSMKKRIQSLKDKYGNDAKQIMYAIATKRAIDSVRREKPIPTNKQEETIMNVEQLLEQIFTLDEDARAELFEMAAEVEEELFNEEFGDQNTTDTENLKEGLSFKEFMASLKEEKSSTGGEITKTSTGYKHKRNYTYDPGKEDDEQDDDKSSESKPKARGTYKPRSAETKAAAAAKAAAAKAANRAKRMAELNAKK